MMCQICGEAESETGEHEVIIFDTEVCGGCLDWLGGEAERITISEIFAEFRREQKLQHGDAWEG